MVTEDLYATAWQMLTPSDIRAVTRNSVEYPPLLGRLSNAPAVLYVSGTISDEDRDAVAVVGSRRAAPDVLNAATGLGRGLAERGRTVVSGLARGVDAAAHRGALLVPRGRTIAVVATGLDRTFPPEHKELDLAIRERGAVVSPYPVGQPATRSAFLARNELIAGMTVASIVVVADEHSGTRAELDHAISQGKPVFFWAPLMRHAPWARSLERRGKAAFIEDAGEALEMLSGLR